MTGVKAACAAAIVLAAPVGAAQLRDYTVPAGPLGPAAIEFGRQAGLSIGIRDPAVAARRSGGVNGRLDTAAALARLLAGTQARASFLDPLTVIIDAAPVPPKSVPVTASLPRTRPPLAATPAGPDIIVAASKQGLRLGDYPGSVQVTTLNRSFNAAQAALGTEGLVALVTALNSTSLGPGRNKLFIRGAADSSFNGPSQATVGQYLGDVRLTFNAPDPSLSLYDLDRVEVLEGPQGTLYGTGSLGGLIRLVPAAPDAGALAASAAAGGLAVAHGQMGGDAAAMLNLPIRHDRLAIRAVGYVTVDPGYIDDVGDGRRDVNRTTIAGGRATLRYTPGAWTIDMGGVAQNIVTRDGQYADRDLPPLTRSSHFPQPFDNDYRLAFVTASTPLGAALLTSTTSYVRHDLDTTYDATGFGGGTRPLRYREDIGIDLVSHETRVSGVNRHGWRWVTGIALTYDLNRLDRQFDPAGPELPALGVRNRTREAAAFGQIAVPITASLTVTGGGRGTFSSQDGNPLSGKFTETQEPTRRNFDVAPLLALAWTPRPRLSVYVRYQEGNRAGGLSILSTAVPPVAQRYETDKIAAFEAGVRFGHAGDPLSFDLAVSRSRWSDIQSDLIDATGLPYTANIGDGRILGVEGRVAWRPLPGLTFDAALLLNDSDLDRPAAAFLAARRELPNIPRAGARLGSAWHHDLSDRVALDLEAMARYVGHSRLGIGAPLDQLQGDYVDTALHGRLGLGHFGISVDLTNVADTKGNRFAFGNPFQLASHDLITPLRPRSLRLGLDWRL